MESASFSWLHLTDFHFGLGGQKALWSTLRQPFFEDLALLHESTGPWQAVVFTGDLVQSGNPKEFEGMQQEVLDRIWRKLAELGSKEAKLLAIPGNHDLVRPTPKSGAVDMLLLHGGFQNVSGTFWGSSNNEYRAVIDKAFASYTEWWQSVPYRRKEIVSGILPGDFATSIDCGDKRIGIVGLNTTFLQLQSGDYKGRLVWDVKQLEAVCRGAIDDWREHHDLCLLLTHQGPDWLTSEASTHGESEIAPAGRFAVHFFGHMHEMQMTYVRIGGDPEAVRRCQMCSVFGMELFGEPPQTKRSHGYAVGKIGFSGANATFRLWPRIATNKTGRWRYIPDSVNAVLQNDHGTYPEAISMPRRRVDRPPPPPDKGVGVTISKEKQILERICKIDDVQLVSDLLLGHWTLSQLEEVVSENIDSALQVVRSVPKIDGTWRRLLGAFVASRVDLPPQELVSPAFVSASGLHWGSRFPFLAYLRFLRESKRNEAANCLAKAMSEGRLGGFDDERLAIYGYGFLAGNSSIHHILDKNGAFIDNYANEKLGPYAVLAYLHCYLEKSNDRDATVSLREFTTTFRATEALGNLRLTFFDYADELQCLPPGRAAVVFRHLRDNAHRVPLTAVLAALSARPNSLLLEELIALARRDQDFDVSAGALHAAAYIGTRSAESRLRERLADGLPGAQAAWLLAIGCSKSSETGDEILSAINDRNLPIKASWLDDVKHNAMWAAGELGRVDPDFAVKALNALCEEPVDSYGRALAWLGIAKAGRASSKEAIQTAFECASDFFEKTILSAAAAIAGWPDLLPAGIKGTIENHGPLYRLLPHIGRDVRAALREYAGEGGRALVQLLDLGDFT